MNDSPANDSNCKMEKMVLKNVPHLALFASSDIEPSDEIRYDYGDENVWWRKASYLN